MSEWIIDTMVSMTLLMALVLILRKPVSHYFGAHVAYLLWALPLARLFMPVLTLEAPAPAPMADPVTAAPAIASDFALAAPVQQAATSALFSVDWLMIAAVVWLGGAGMLFVSKLAAYFQFREDIVSDGQLVGKHGNIRILETAAVSGPLAFGLFKKYIAVPTDFFRNYAPRERELALDHEIAHHESGDLAANFVGLLVLSLHWFNPVAWFAWIAFREDQETACDARILQKTGQNGGQNLRAVYGRTIAKSASGHRLGLASPLGQKDKIKGRLKMLGQSEKSTFRKRLGAVMVGVGTVVALPLTATVSYAEADVADEKAADESKASAKEAVHVEKRVKVVKGKDGKKEKVIKIRKHKGGSADHSAHDLDLEAKDGEFVRKIERDGKTIVLRTNRELSDEEVEKYIKEAEESRFEADEALREAREELRNLDIDVDSKEIRREIRRELKEAEKEIEEARREMRRSLRESRREISEARREAFEAQREAMREAHEAEREAHRAAKRSLRHTTNNWSIANQIAEISFAPRPRAPVKPVHPKTKINCKAMNKQIAFGGPDGALKDQAWAVVAGCGNFEVKIDRTAMLKLSLKQMKKERAKAANCNRKDKKHKQKMRAYDRDIKALKRQLSMT